MGLALGQQKVAAKSNEITAIPALLEAMVIKGCLISIDAMGCQKEIVRLIRQMGGDYLVAVKGNQPKLHETLQAAFLTSAPVNEAKTQYEVIQSAQDRLVLQCYRLLPNTGQVDSEIWQDCRWLGQVDSLRITPSGEETLERRYYITSGKHTGETFAQATRNHWGVENRLHWCLDVIFNEDARRLAKDNGPQNFSLLTKIALNLLRQDTSEPKKSLRVRRKRTGWDDDRKMALLGLNPL
jgi:predicted transposase YbfD/YdcC